MCVTVDETREEGRPCDARFLRWQSYSSPLNRPSIVLPLVELLAHTYTHRNADAHHLVVVVVDVDDLEPQHLGAQVADLGFIDDKMAGYW